MPTPSLPVWSHSLRVVKISILALAASLATAWAAEAGGNRVVPELGIELLWVKPGTFTMGSAPEEADRDKAEGPQTMVTISKGFWLGKTEMTQAQYEAFTGTNPSYFKAVGPDAPVEEVSWLDATDFCKKLTERERAAGRLPEGYVYGLPTEAQWEYAYRAGTRFRYPGDPDLSAWHVGNSKDTSHPVAKKNPNPWGFYDMAGNIAEWCSDWYGPYKGGEQTDPAGPANGYFRMARGGSWRVAERVGRSAARSGGSEGRRDYTLGFRLALVPERAKRGSGAR